MSGQEVCTFRKAVMCLTVKNIEEKQSLLLDGLGQHVYVVWSNNSSL